MFAGQDTANPPVPDSRQHPVIRLLHPDHGAVAGLAANGAAATIARRWRSASSNAAGTSPFSTYLSQPPAMQSPLPTVRGRITPARARSACWPAPTPAIASSGHLVNRLVHARPDAALATIGSLSSARSPHRVFARWSRTRAASLSGAITAMAADVGVLGDRQTRTRSTQTVTLSDAGTALTAQMSNAQDVDMATTLSELSQAQTQLQASYQLIAGTKTAEPGKLPVAWLHGVVNRAA